MASINARALAKNFVDDLPEFRGDLVESLVATVEQTTRAEGTDVPTAEAPAAPSPSHHHRRGPALILKPDSRNYVRMTELPPQAELSCSTADCFAKAALLVDSRDCEVLPYCKDCANVEGAMWLAGVRR